MDNVNNQNTPQPSSTVEPLKPQKKAGFFKKLLRGIFVLVIILVLILGYLGFMPGVSKIFGSDKPRNLGIKTSAQDEESINSKLNIQYLSLSGPNSYTLSGQKNVDVAFTDKELTALMASHEKMWKHYPVSNAQVKFNSDGTAEISGILRTDKIYSYVAATGIAVGDMQKWMDKINILVDNPPFYVKGKAEVKNGVLVGELIKVEIGRLPLPLSLIAPEQSEIVGFAQNRLDKAGVKVQEGSFQEGKVNFKGSLPAQVGFAK